jgi:hypothetical protein
MIAIFSVFRAFCQKIHFLLQKHSNEIYFVKSQYVVVKLEKANLELHIQDKFSAIVTF